MSRTAPIPRRTEPISPPRPAGETLPAGSATTEYPFLLPPDEDGDLGRLAGYRVFGVLGSGGMGTVFAAEDVALKRPVALKVMNPDLASDPVNGWQRFFREARALAAIKHPNLVTVYQVGHEGDAVYLAMERLVGQTLAARILRGGPPTPAEVVRVGSEVAAGLSAIHDRGLIHRDIKPANIWVESAGGRIKLLDFGLVRSVHEDTQLTEAGMIVGTPAYMSPEQVRGRALDCRTDLFSLGCVLYVLCTGRQPFEADNPMAQAAALAADEPTPVRELNPTIPAALSDLVGELMAKNPDDRPATAAAVIERLAAALRPRVVDAVVVEEDEPVVVAKPRRVKGKPKRRRSFARRHAVKIIAGLCVVVVGLVVAAIAGGRGNTNAKVPDTAAPTAEPEVVYLANLTPATATSWPPPRFPPGTDGSVRVGGELSPNGLFMHPTPPDVPPVSLTYKLAKGYSRFTAKVALNDSAPPFAPPGRFVVYRDGVKWDSGPVSRNATQVCDLDVRGVEELTLEVPCDGDPRGIHTVWVEPRVIK